MARKTHLSLADNDLNFKEFLVRMLEMNPTYRVVKNCNNGHELITQLYLKLEDVYLINLFMPILSGMEAIKIIRKSDPDTPIIAYSPTFQVDMDQALQDMPHVYYCQKNTLIIKEILLGCVLSSQLDYKDYHKEWANQVNVVKNYYDRQRRFQEELSSSDIQLLKLCYEGYSNKEIADLLSLSKRTVDTYIVRLTKKLELKNKIELIKFCVENGYYNSDF